MVYELLNYFIWSYWWFLLFNKTPKNIKWNLFKLLYEAANTDTCRMLFSKWFPMAYHYIFQFQFGTVGERSGMSIKQSKIHLCEIALMFPQGVLIRFMQGKQCQVEGKIAKAIGKKRYHK